MEFTLYFIHYVSSAILAVVSLEIPSPRSSESDLFTTTHRCSYAVAVIRREAQCPRFHSVSKFFAKLLVHQRQNACSFDKKTIFCLSLNPLVSIFSLKYMYLAKFWHLKKYSLARFV